MVPVAHICSKYSLVVAALLLLCEWCFGGETSGGNVKCILQRPYNNFEVYPSVVEDEVTYRPSSVAVTDTSCSKCNEFVLAGGVTVWSLVLPLSSVVHR